MTTRIAWIAGALLLIAGGCGQDGESPRMQPRAEADSGAVADASPVISEHVASANTLPELLQQVQAEREGLRSALAAGSIEEAHEHAAAIRELVQGVPVLTPSVPLNRARRLDALVAKVEQHAEVIEQSGDAPDAQSVAALEAALDEIIRVCAETGDGD